MFRKIIKEKLQKQGISASAFAERIGLKPATLTEFLAGRKDLQSSNLERILRGLNGLELSELKVDYLMNTKFSAIFSEHPMYLVNKFELTSIDTENEFASEILKVAKATFKKIRWAIYCGLCAEIGVPGKKRIGIQSYLNQKEMEEKTDAILKSAGYKEEWNEDKTLYRYYSPTHVFTFCIDSKNDSHAEIIFKGVLVIGIR